MANAKSTTKKPGEALVVEKKHNTEETQFSIKQLKEHSRAVFGVKREIIEGALFDYKKEKITKTEASNLIKKFLQKVVK
ncbi:hypothetical protein [Listeria seeligeri]|uniref:hypothetical protein n=1 Tax=Listeria seeligeri TaxID=1640 RepID=UPI0016263D94|nr:hypothetical protein [Listeria seeligeri]MBC1824228.1 hypothetical protein [Listeria seeligeri]MBC1837838.1 hypothetical protein [Listeria seeligeri]